MLDPKKISARASELLAGRGSDSKLSPQAEAVIDALSEVINSDLLLVDKAIKQKNAVRETPTGRMKKPTREEIRLHGAKIGLPELECDKFFDYYESNGWRVRSNPMRLWTGALANWKRYFEERNGYARGPIPSQNGHLTGAQVVLFTKEHERVLERMRVIRSQYESHQSWSDDDKAEFHKLKGRRDELRTKLGITL